jgi:DNA polymerase III alpha subunit
MLDGEVKPEIWQLTEKMEMPPQGITDHNFVFGYRDADQNWVKGSSETDPALMEYIKRYPKHWDIVSRALGVVKGKGRHASAYVITNEPVSNFIPVTRIGDMVCTAYNMKGVESAGGIKMDYLGISTLDDIEVCIRLIQKRAGWTPQDVVIDGKKVPHMRVIPKMEKDGQWHFYDVWDLPEDHPVFADIATGKTNKSIFQFGTPAAQQWLKEFAQPDGTSTIKSIEDLAAFTALDRPGGLDSFVDTVDGHKRNMLQEFAARAAGKQACKDRLAILDELFPETYGVLTYQEQLQKAFVALGGTTPEEGDEFRVHVSKKQAEKVMKDKAVFMKGAVARLGQDDAERLWGMLETFANYGFNKSHAVCYSVIGYACAWLQHHFNLEWWTAVLSNADRGEIDSTFWVHAGHLVDQPDVKLSGDDFEIQGTRIRAPLRLLMGVGPAAHEEMVKGRPYHDLRDFLQRIKDRKVPGPDGKKGRSAINRGIITKLIVSGCADALFPEDKRGDVYTKLTYFEETEADVNNRRRRNGSLKVEPVDRRFDDISPIQRFLLTKSVLPSYTAPLAEYISEMGRTDWRRESGRYAYWSPEKFEGENWTMVLPGPAVRAVLDGTIKGVSPKCRFSCVAYVSEHKTFWGGKALKVNFEVDGERFQVNQWPRTVYEAGEKKRIAPTLPGRSHRWHLHRHTESLGHREGVHHRRGEARHPSLRAEARRREPVTLCYS